MRCAECGAQTARETQFCAKCGAPIIGLPAIAVPGAGEPDDHPETPPGPAKEARPWPAAVRRLFLAGLTLSLILLAIGQIGVVRTHQGTHLHGTMVLVSWLGILGALLFLVLFECAGKQFSLAQMLWPMVQLGSAAFLAPLPFLWLAVVRRRVRDWAVFAVYLAVTIAVIVALWSAPSNSSLTGLPAVLPTLLLVIAPVHVVLAFSPAAKVPTWSEAFPSLTFGQRRQPVDEDALPAADQQLDAG